MELVRGKGFPSSSTELVKKVVLRVDHLGYYWALGLEPGSSISEVKRKYRDLAKIFHPDGSDPDREAFFLLQEIYDTLSDRDKKSKYDLVVIDRTCKPQTEEERSRFLELVSSKIDGWTYYGRREDNTYVQWAYEELLRLSYRDGINFRWRLTVGKGRLIMKAPTTDGMYLKIPTGTDIEENWREVKSLLDL